MNRLICLVVVAMLYASGLMAQRAPQELNEAIRRGDLEGVQHIIAQGVGFGVPRGERYPPLHVAADAGHVEIIAALFEAGAPLNQRGGWTLDGALHQAVQRGCFYAADLLLRLGADVNLQDRFGLTVLHLAVDQRDVDLVNLILDAEANADLPDGNGVTALHLAVQRKSYEVLRALLDGGVDCHIFNTRGNTPLHEAVLLKDPVMIDLLLRAGAQVNDRNARGFTVLNMAFLSGTVDALNALNEAVLRDQAMAMDVGTDDRATVVLQPVDNQMDCDRVIVRRDDHRKRGREASGVQNTPPKKKQARVANRVQRGVRL